MAQTLTLKWRRHGQGWGRSSASVPMPTLLHRPEEGSHEQAALLTSTAHQLLRRNLQVSYSHRCQMRYLDTGTCNRCWRQHTSTWTSGQTTFAAYAAI